MAEPSISVIGGKGRMGGLLVRLFEASGCPVRVFDARTGPVDWAEAAKSEIVVLAVPISAVGPAAEALGPHTRPDGAVIDIASLKEPAVRSMLDHCRGEVIGGHPLFGPDVKDLAGRLFFLSPARPGRHYEWFKTFLEKSGALVREIGPAEHDRLMSRVQLLRHLFIFCFGRSLQNLAFEPGRDRDEAGPWFSELLAQLTRQLDQSPEMYADMTLFSPHAGQVATEFERAASDVARSFGSRDKDAITGMIRDLSSYFEGAGKSDPKCISRGGAENAENPLLWAV